jgi:hypothetical protein
MPLSMRAVLSTLATRRAPWTMTAVEEYGLAQPIFRGVSYAVGHWVLVNLIIWRLVPQHSLMTQKTVQST